MFLPWRRLLALTLFAWSPALAEVRSLTVLHVNDIHAQLSPSDRGDGGLAYLAGAIRRERAGCIDCILLNAGDLVQGSPVSTIFRGLPVYEVANLLGFDAATLGNHEFDYGWMQARKFVETAKYPIVSANLVDGGGRLFTSKAYVILKVNGLRVAVIGAITDDMPYLTTPAQMGQWRAKPPLAAARRYASEARPKSDLVILLGHLDGEEEQEFMDSAPEIPVMVTGHLHDGMQETPLRDGRLLVRVKSNARQLGKLKLRVDTRRKAPISSEWTKISIGSSSTRPGADVAEQVERWEAEVAAHVDQPLAVSRRKFGKLAVKRLLERAMREQTGSDFAFMNLGGVRDTLPEGVLRVRHIWNVMPFDNRVVIGRVRGRQLPAAVLGGRKVDFNREYTLAVSDFTAHNQSARSQLGTTGLVFNRDAGPMRDLLVEWFRKTKTIE